MSVLTGVHQARPVCVLSLTSVPRLALDMRGMLEATGSTIATAWACSLSQVAR